MASQITSLTIVCSTVYADADQRKHQSSASLAIVQGIHRWPVNSPHKGLVTRQMFPFDDVIMFLQNTHNRHLMAITGRKLSYGMYFLPVQLLIFVMPFSSGVCLTHWGWVTHICVSNLTITGWTAQIMACRLAGAKPLSEPMLEYW